MAPVFFAFFAPLRETLLLMRDELEQAIRANQPAFSVELTDGQLARLTEYYQLVLEHNALLHLVAPCSAEAFAIRHILESLTLLDHLPQNARLADAGSGAGLPSIPCLLVREDLSARLIESKEKKAKFLGLALEQLGLSPRAAVVNRQFEESDLRDCQFVTARALDKFTERLPRLLKWARGKELLLFGGKNLGAALEKANRRVVQKVMPMSEQRYLYVLSN